MRFSAAATGCGIFLTIVLFPSALPASLSGPLVINMLNRDD
jgi:hypothetical protein